LDGINTGIVRLRTANGRLDWENTSLVVGQDSLFISPNSPTSFASLLVPSLGYSGNLWAWIPQVRLEHKFNLNDDQSVSFQAGILDNVTGERSYSSQRLPQAGEASGRPAFAARTSWTRNIMENRLPSGQADITPDKTGVKGGSRMAGRLLETGGSRFLCDLNFPARLTEGRVVVGVAVGFDEPCVLSGILLFFFPDYCRL